MCVLPDHVLSDSSYQEIYGQSWKSQWQPAAELLCAHVPSMQELPLPTPLANAANVGTPGS